METAYSEALSAELEASKIPVRVMVLEPAAFGTKGVTGYYSEFDEADKQISDYDPLRKAAHDTWINLGKKPEEGGAKGDPRKAMEFVVDVVRGEGKAAGKALPMYLPLGELADQGIRAKIQTRLQNLDEWGPLIRDMNFDN
jgi:hypothetical protein